MKKKMLFMLVAGCIAFAVGYVLTAEHVQAYQCCGDENCDTSSCVRVYDVPGYGYAACTNNSGTKKSCLLPENTPGKYQSSYQCGSQFAGTRAGECNTGIGSCGGNRNMTSICP